MVVMLPLQMQVVDSAVGRPSDSTEAEKPQDRVRDWTGKLGIGNIDLLPAFRRWQSDSGTSLLFRVRGIGTKRATAWRPGPLFPGSSQRGYRGSSASSPDGFFYRRGGWHYWNDWAIGCDGRLAGIQIDPAAEPQGRLFEEPPKNPGNEDGNPDSPRKNDQGQGPRRGSVQSDAGDPCYSPPDRCVKEIETVGNRAEKLNGNARQQTGIRSLDRTRAATR